MLKQGTDKHGAVDTQGNQIVDIRLTHKDQLINLSS